LAVFTIIAALGLAGFVVLDGLMSWAAAVVAGLASTVQLILLVSIPAAIAKGLGVTRLSAGTTLVGYAIAFVLPVIGGWLAESAGETEMALLPALIFSFLMIPALGRDRRYVCKSVATSVN
jgi:CP family cyanate transporter-like MFS transporter